MTKTIEMQWDEDVTVLGEHCPADKLDRAKYAQFLTGFLAGQGFDETKPEGEQKKNYVLNLNSEWGSGKTYFLKRWYHDLKQHYPVVYVDAWKQDYSDDPLMTVISSMTKQLREQAGKSENDLLFKAPRKTLGLLKAALPSAAGALAKRYLGIDLVAIMEAADEGDVGKTIKDAEGKDIDMGAAASKLVQYLLDEHDAKSDAITSLKKSVAQWIEAAKGNKKLSYPAFIFIDELDRCRPSYAVEMLETIKHIFDIPGVVFVVGTDTEQLQHAVKAIYGEGFDARTYLGRFFNSRCTLKKPSFSNFLDVHCDMHKLSFEYLRSQKITVWPVSNNEHLNAYQVITKIYDAFDIQARQAVQLTSRLIAIISSVTERSIINLPYLIFHLCLKEKDPHQYLEWQQYIYKGEYEKLPFLNYSSSDANLCFYINPQELFTRFPLDDDGFRTTNNQWPNKLYKCSMRTFIVETTKLLDRLENKKNTLDPYGKFKDEFLSCIDPYDHKDSSEREEAAWIFINLIESHNSNAIQKFDYYYDLVELAYGLDSYFESD